MIYLPDPELGLRMASEKKAGIARRFGEYVSAAVH